MTASPRTPRRAMGCAIFSVATLLALHAGWAQADNSPKPATAATQARHADWLTRLPFQDKADFDDARRGFVGAVPDSQVLGADGKTVWSLKPYDFLKANTAPDTVNPSLWRQAQLNAIHGLFKVTDRVYQVRGMDLANMTIIEGDSGLIIIDPLLSVETAQAALKLYFAHRPARPVVAVVYSHSHVDHFGGVRGVTHEADVAAGKTKIIAPDGFMEHAVAENVFAGNAMSRRAQFQFGPLLATGPRGQVDTGLGKNVSNGTISLLAPTDLIKKNLDQRTVDGVEIVFQLTPGTEAPSEMNLYFPQFKLLNMAENTSHNMHNLYTIRGAEVRDGNAWSRYLADAMREFGGRTDVLIAQHHWPTWGKDKILPFIAAQRDLYKFINDQSLRLLNQGYKPDEIAQAIKLPASLEKNWALRGYYGTLSHNARAVYQKYMGWYDANPANLEPLPPIESAKKAIEYMGGAAAAIERAKADFAQGNYRWVASVMNQVVFADPANKAARALGADALEQLGFQAEAATWRNAYLFGAQELRQGMTTAAPRTTPPDLVRALSMDLVFDAMGTRLNAPKAEGKKLLVHFKLSEPTEQYVLRLENSALTHDKGAPTEAADAVVTLSRDTWNAITLKEIGFPRAMLTGKVKIDGAMAKVIELFSLLDDFTPDFDVIEPLKNRR
jgi:alkyl sulfatase BDS1-like metallo-beta-lactamase superfamily hydrolase